jgi:hypothetical protein
MKWIFETPTNEQFPNGVYILKVEKSVHVKPGDVHDYGTVVSHPEFYR